MAKRISLLFWLAVLVGCRRPQAPEPPAREALAVFSEPTIGITPPDTTGTFHFSFCGQVNALPVIERIQVSRAGQRVGGPLPYVSYCLWKKGSGVALSSEWKYGSMPRGSTTIGTCPPFRAGDSYEVLVDGSGSGSLEFKVTPEGVIDVSKDSCLPRAQ